ncbi:MAG TPA: redox-sensing transcriptional repressor Rex, partial [Blastocatellia bacterium]|nr:redox-sensing transcriptional repressor Rex [Blastocatellia bacterium]
QLSIDIAAIAVPARAAERVLGVIAGAGVKAVLNFAPIRLAAPPGMKIKEVDLLVSLESLSHFLQRRAEAARASNSDARSHETG